MIRCAICQYSGLDNHALSQHVRFAHKMKIVDYKNDYCGAKITLTCKNCGASKCATNKHDLCQTCYVHSDAKVQSGKMNAKKRRSYSGVDNPKYRNAKILFRCECGKEFKRYLNKEHRDGTQPMPKYCSVKCKGHYDYFTLKRYRYNDINFRSSWEAAFAHYLDLINVKYEYEPKRFKTSHGSYLPDFLLIQYDKFIEIKGYWRTDALEKFEEVRKQISIICLNKEKLEQLGFQKVRSGVCKGQLVTPITPNKLQFISMIEGM